MPNYPYTFQLPPLNVQDIPNDGVAGEFLGINGSGVLDWLTAGGGDMLKADNLLGLASYPTARTNLGLGTGDSPTFANLTLTSPSLVSSAPVTISQTWNAVGQTFKAFVVNAAGTSGTNSASGSLLLDLQVGGASKFNVYKDGSVTIGAGLIKDWGSGQLGIGAGGSVLYVSSAAVSCTNQFAIGASFGIPTVFIARDADNTLALRNGAAAQTFNIYGTYSTSPSLAYSRLAIACDTSGNATLTTQSTGVAGTVSINGVPVGLGKGNVVSNVAVGTSALNGVTTGSQNIAIGYESSIALTNGNGNTSIGFRSLRASTGSQNVSIGADSLQQNSSGSNNTSVGYTALNPNTTGGSNSAIGYDSGRFISGGVTPNTITNNSVYLGALTKANASSETNQIVIGYDATGIGSNSVVLGNDSITKTALKGNVGIGTTAPGSPLDVFKSAAGADATGGGLSVLRSTAAGDHRGGAIYSRYISGGSADFLVFGVTGVSGKNPYTDFDQARMVIGHTGNVGIGTTSPTSKLQVTGGDVEIETVTSGIIMKAAGTATRYRITLNAGGTDLVFTAI